MQRGPWDMQIHHEPFQAGTRLEAISAVGAIRPVEAHKVGDNHILTRTRALDHKEKKRITKMAPHPYDDLFDETHIDLMA